MSNAASTLGFNRVAIVDKTGMSSRDLRKWFEKIEQKTFNMDTTGTFPASDLTGAFAVATTGPLVVSGQAILSVAPISAGSFALNSFLATGVLATDVIQWCLSGAPTNGYASGSLHIYAYPAADAVKFQVCNPTASPITPGAMTLNYQVLR